METLEFGAEKVLLQGHTRRWEVYALKSPELPERFWQSTFIFILFLFFIFLFLFFIYF